MIVLRTITDLRKAHRSEDNRGPGSRPCVGSLGLGVWGCRTPMSTLVQQRAGGFVIQTETHLYSAIGIVSREAIETLAEGFNRRPEPGSRNAANRPCISAAGESFAGVRAIAAAAAAVACAACRADTAAAPARIHTPPSNTGVNKVWGVEHGDN